MTKFSAELGDTINRIVTNRLVNTHTITIAKITAVNNDTVDVQIIFPYMVNNEPTKYPEIPQVPVVHLYGGGMYETFPISIGDYCLLFVTERASDSFINGQDFVNPDDERLHDLTDCFAFVGIKPMSDALEITEVIKRVGDNEHEGNTEQTGDYTQQGNYTITDNIAQTGDYDIAGNISQQGDYNITGNINQTGTFLVNGVFQTTGAAQIGGAIQTPSLQAGSVTAGNGATGNFIDKNNKSITVVGGIVTSIV